MVVAGDAVVTQEELHEWVRVARRSTRVPAAVHQRAELPYNETGKLLRRVIREELANSSASGRGAPSRC